ncbi:hypothetical protein, partial [Vibrio ouci]|uniref:hypothetical protein n=1 Tax=Vibrio ouci TaxID=2499078 RepID=UPI001ABF48BE
GSATPFAISTARRRKRRHGHLFIQPNNDVIALLEFFLIQLAPRHTDRFRSQTAVLRMMSTETGLSPTCHASIAHA